MSLGEKSRALQALRAESKLSILRSFLGRMMILRVIFGLGISLVLSKVGQCLTFHAKTKMAMSAHAKWLYFMTSRGRMGYRVCDEPVIVVLKNDCLW